MSGDELRRRREALGMTQRALATALGIHLKALGNAIVPVVAYELLLMLLAVDDTQGERA